MALSPHNDAHPTAQYRESKTPCRHRRCRVWRFFRIIETAAFCMADPRWPICLERWRYEQ